MSDKGEGSSVSSVGLFQRDFWAVIYYDFFQGRSFQECFQSLKHCFEDRSPSNATIFRWFRQFMSGERTLEDDDCCGRMATIITPENIYRVKSLIEDRKTATADWYVNHCLPRIFQAWCKRCPRTGVCGLLLHHDNASAHTAAVTLDFFVSRQWCSAGHPPTIFT